MFRQGLICDGVRFARGWWRGSRVKPGVEHRAEDVEKTQGVRALSANSMLYALCPLQFLEKRRKNE